MAKIYTREGDEGFTTRVGGIHLKKNHNIIKMCGALDELNCYIGVVLASHYHADTYTTLLTVQKDLFDLSLAVQEEKDVKNIDGKVAYLESQIDFYDAKNDPLDEFIHPTGSKACAHLHYARAICRRVEIMTIERFLCKINSSLTRYLNRLGDLLFVMARYLNYDKERKIK